MDEREVVFSYGNTGPEYPVPARKIAISLPEPVLRAVDRMAAERGLARSQLIAQILREVADRRRDQEIGDAVDAIFADDSVAALQRDTSELFVAAGSWVEADW